MAPQLLVTRQHELSSVDLNHPIQNEITWTLATLVLHIQNTNPKPMKLSGLQAVAASEPSGPFLSNQLLLTRPWPASYSFLASRT